MSRVAVARYANQMQYVTVFMVRLGLIYSIIGPGKFTLKIVGSRINYVNTCSSRPLRVTYFSQIWMSSVQRTQVIIKGTNIYCVHSLGRKNTVL